MNGPAPCLRFRAFATALCWILVAAAGGSGERSREPLDGTDAPVAGPLRSSVVAMTFPSEVGPSQRPPVTFRHGVHTNALMDEGCETCHTIRPGKLDPTLAATLDVSDRDALIDAYHGACMGCHESRAKRDLKAGPVTCGECHDRRHQMAPERAELRFDYSLHGRHALAYPDKCDPCHHVLDEVTKKLVYVKGKEEACDACHGARDEDAKLSLQNASHVSCVGCHLERRRTSLEAGPVLCVGCHDPDKIRSIKRIDPVPRLVRGQPDTLWVHTEGVNSYLVPFDHLSHENHTSSCSECHHDGLQPCGECHTPTGSSGGGVTLQTSQHTAGSSYGCVGCHRRTARANDCVGCHEALPRPPGEASCRRCHAGPLPPSDGDEPPRPVIAVPELAPLPPSSDDFPENVEIALLVNRYQPAKLPHRKIVERLDAAVRKGSLARSLHGATETLCAGCHHHMPVGVRPAECRSCHGDAALAGVDRPGLEAAYHRQCLGCHQRMGVDKLGCTDCHREREEST